jgi:quercetin dioxygenase-like cupin family protein
LLSTLLSELIRSSAGCIQSLTSTRTRLIGNQRPTDLSCALLRNRKATAMTTKTAAPQIEKTEKTRFLRHAEGETHPVMGDPMRFIMTADHSDGGYALSEQVVRPGNGAPPHIHHNEAESFYVLEGEFTVTADGVEHRLQRGDFIHVPRGSVRGFSNVGKANGRVLILHCPGSAADFYITMGKLPFPPKMEDIAALGKKYGIELVSA